MKKQDTKKNLTTEKKNSTTGATTPSTNAKSNTLADSKKAEVLTPKNRISFVKNKDPKTGKTSDLNASLLNDSSLKEDSTITSKNDESFLAEKPPSFINSKSETYSYSGLSLYNTRHGLGCNFIIDTKEIYFGTWEKNKKKTGLNIFSSNSEGPTELFYGDYSENKKNKGIYLWQTINGSSYIPDIEAFIGKFKDGIMDIGLYYSRNHKNNKLFTDYLYLGKIVSNKKTDDNAQLLTIEGSECQFFIGKVEDNEKKNGKVKISFGESEEDYYFYDSSRNVKYFDSHKARQEKTELETTLLVYNELNEGLYDYLSSLSSFSIINFQDTDSTDFSNEDLEKLKSELGDLGGKASDLLEKVLDTIK